MSLTEVPPNALGVFTDSQQRYAEYYLQLPRYIGDDFTKLQVEIPNLDRALQWAIQTEQVGSVPGFWNHVKDHLWDHGYWHTFLEWGENALSALHDLGTPEPEAWLLSELGWFWMEQSDFSIAKNMFERAHNLFRSLHNHKGECAVLRYLGVLAYRRGELSEAEGHYDRALELATAEGLTGMVAEIRNLQGSLARKLGDFDRARDYYYEARNAIRELGDTWRLTAVLRNLARMEFQLGNLQEARAGFIEAIEICDQIDRVDMRYGCQLRLAEVELRLGNPSTARSLATVARTGFAELGMQRDLDEANQFLLDLALEQ